MHLLEELPSPAWPKVCLPGYQGVTAREDGCLCPSPPVFGRKTNLPTQGQSHAFWWGVYWSWGKRWNATSPFLMKPSSVAWPSQRNPWPCYQRKSAPKNAQPVYVVSPAEEATVKATKEELTRRKHPPIDSQGGRKVLHPSRLVIAAGQIPPISQVSKQRPCSRSSGERMAWCQQANEELKAQNIKSEPTSPTKMLDVAQHVTPPPGFLGVMACLWRSSSPEKACDVPPAPLTDSSSDGFHCGDDECQLHCKGWGHWGDLYGYHTHFHGESGPQWPWAGDPNQGAHHTGHHRPHMMN